MEQELAAGRDLHEQQMAQQHLRARSQDEAAREEQRRALTELQERHSRCLLAIPAGTWKLILYACSRENLYHKS